VTPAANSDEKAAHGAHDAGRSRIGIGATWAYAGRVSTQSGHPALKQVQIREHVRGLALAATPAAQLPSERELGARFGVARMTVRLAVDSLVSEGLVERVPGRGLFAGRGKVDLQLRVASYSDEMRKRGLVPSSQVLSTEVAPGPAEVADLLGVPPECAVVHLRRLRLADAEPMALEEAWVSTAVLPDWDPASVPSSLYGAIEARGWTLTHGEDSVDAEVATAEQARRLKIRTRAPLLRIRRRTYAGRVLVHLSDAVYRADRYTLRVPISASHEVSSSL
jgi:GntR family transcriptional regulator